jgi:hypothetical protein
VRRNIDSISIQFEDEKSTDENIIEAMMMDLFRHFHIYDNLSREYESFLKGSRSVASIREEAAHRLVVSTVRAKIDMILQEMREAIQHKAPIPFISLNCNSYILLRYFQWSKLAHLFL